ncbi:MAG: beta-propeller domain-containing protein [Hyphomonadaceae bacterium]|nr:beta-propeller domain-containing protein [Hyphomonadaceae bacterium]
MRRHWAALGLMLLSACATPTPVATTRGQAPTWPTLSQFSSDLEFQAYLDAVARADASDHSNSKATPPDDPCPPEQPDCNEANEQVVVTGTRMAARPASAVNPAITNVQTAGVDEGDIVKMIGRFLIVLQDGRLFSVDTGATTADMRLVDRANVYRRRDADVWYDEILVHQNRILVTGYNYEENATEFTVFSLTEDGRFIRESAYFLSSNDYYDGDNYATRLVDGNLVIYTPIFDLRYNGGRDQWPIVRRWLGESEHGARSTAGRPLFDARDIYRPIQQTFDPAIHTISVCPLGSSRAGDELECSNTAILGPSGREFYVSNDHVYLWLFYDDADEADASCLTRKGQSFESAAPSALYQISLSGGRARAMFLRGAPNDQLGMQATANAFHALTVWTDLRCDFQQAPPLRFLSAPLAGFSTTPFALPEENFTMLPGGDGRGIENRFTANHLIYGERSSRSSYAYDDPDDSEPTTGRVVAVPNDNPAAAQVIETTHNIIRVESIGEDAVLTGYHGANALSISVLDLGRAPTISDTERLDGRYESEGRSHAFNAAIEADGTGLLGLPTSQARWRSGRWVWDSESSDVSFLSLGRGGELNTLGELRTNKGALHRAYRCEVSCIDWYGNTRPVFVGGRVFALSGVELIEGDVQDGRIIELRRINLSAPPPRRSKVGAD